MKKSILSVREMVEMAMLVAIAILLDLDFLKITINADGGSISLTLLPLLVLAFRHGPLKGFIAAGVVYGFITCLLDGHGFGTFPLDYLLGYGSVGVAGFFRHLAFNKNPDDPIRVRNYVFLTLAVLSSVLLTLSFWTLSGIVYWGVPFWGSVVYNSVILVSGAIVLTVLYFIYYPLVMINKRFPLARD